MRRWIILGVAGAAVLVAGGLVAAYFLVVADRPSGGLDTELKGVTLTRPKPSVHKPRKKHKVEPVLAADKPCWLNFGGNPGRSLSRIHIHLGKPTKPVWARGLGGYIEYPPSYCQGRLYVNTFRGATYAIDALTGRIIWRRWLPGEKPSTPAIAEDRKSTRLNSSHVRISYAVFCLK